MRVLQINTSYNFSAPGRIASELGNLLINYGHESIVAYGRSCREGLSETIKIGNKADLFFHFLTSRLLDRHGFGSSRATEDLINRIKVINPDVIHLHNIHGYYINIKALFNYLKNADKPIIWTFHDCWPFTGHCSYFDRVHCTKWQSECFNCPLIKFYPESWFFDNSRRNFWQKKALFDAIPNMILICPSSWMAGNLNKSFLNRYPVKVINNGVDLTKFRPLEPIADKLKFNLKGSKLYWEWPTSGVNEKDWQILSNFAHY